MDLLFSWKSCRYVYSFQFDSIYKYRIYIPLLTVSPADTTFHSRVLFHLFPDFQAIEASYTLRHPIQIAQNTIPPLTAQLKAVTAPQTRSCLHRPGIGKLRRATLKWKIRGTHRNNIRFPTTYSVLCVPYINLSLRRDASDEVRNLL